MKLNIGAGDTHIDGYEAIDIKQGVVAHALPYGAETIDEVRASHVLEHYPYERLPEVLKEWFRVLKPGGVIKVSVPDFEFVMREYAAGKPINVQGYLMGGQTDAYDFHSSLFSFNTLCGLLREAGFVNVVRWKSEIDDCAALPISLNLQATKPGLPSFRVVAVASVPRFGPTLHSRCCHEALLPLRIPLKQIAGAYWGQCLTRAMDECLTDDEQKPDLLLALDYDTVFKPWHVVSLLDIMQRRPEVDALIPIQCHRGLRQMLCSVRGDDGEMMHDVTPAMLMEEIMPVASGHFGLTLLRVSALERMSKPWFIGTPDAQGGWGDGRIDDDIHFWNQWRKSGNTAYLANRVPVGHLMELIAWPGKTMEPSFQQIQEFYERGTPADLWAFCVSIF